MPQNPNEATFEETTIQRLQQLGYRYRPGPQIDRPLHTVVLEDELRTYLSRRYRHLPAQVIDLAIQRITTPEGLTLERRNMAFHKLLREGVILPYEVAGRTEHAHLYYLDFDDHRPELNSFLVVNQLTVQGSVQADQANTRRPDVIVYINGLPLVVFELKNPYDEYVDVAGAHNQLGHYMRDIPQLFTFNALCVLSDGKTTLHGMAGASLEWYAPWKSIDGEKVEAATTGSMKTLIEGLFPKDRLLDYVRNFIVHEVVNDKITKKGAKYHQFFAVRMAARRAVQAMQPDSDRRVGVVWHTQGSGKSLSMIFLTGILRRWPELNPTILIQVDRTDLDKQLYDNFVAAKELVGTVHQAGDVNHLRELFATGGGEVICSTIEKFRVGEGEVRHPVLTQRTNVLVMADEAHRTQYNMLDGFAAFLRQALPNASYIGFTGTPIDQEDANTTQLFGDYIHVYDMQQAKEDKAVVGLFYEARHIPLDLSNQALDTDLERIAKDVADQYDQPLPADRLEEAKIKWAAMERAAGTRERMGILAQDLLSHFNQRQKALRGKAMAVCMSRRNAVALYDALTALPNCPEVKVVMTGNISQDPVAWNEAGHITTKARREAIKQRFIDPNDPLQIVIVCDMWLTGFDAPCANTLYVDKPMHGHNLMQAIARVNRIFQDKPAGLIVDYIGIADELKAATRKYTQGGGRGGLTEDLEKEAVAYFLNQLEVTRSHLPPNQPYATWRDLSGVALEDLVNLCMGTLSADPELQEDFLAEEHRLSKAYSLVSHVASCQPYFDEVAFFQILRKNVRKVRPTVRRGMEDLDRAVRDLLDDSISAQPALDVFATSGLGKPNIAILDDEFLAGFKRSSHQDLQMRLLEKLLRDDLFANRKRNLIRTRSFQQMLDETITQYNNRAIDAADVVQIMVDIRKQRQADEARKQELGLSDEELAFYDVIVLGDEQGVVMETERMAELVKEVVQAVRSNVKVDWTRAHRKDVHAGVETAVKRVLRRNRIRGEQFVFLQKRLMQQAEAIYEEWPLAA